MIEKIVNDKKSLELMMKYATAQSKSKKPSEIFENFYKLSQANTDLSQKLMDLQGIVIRETSDDEPKVERLIKKFENKEYIATFIDFFEKLDAINNKDKTSDILATYFTDPVKTKKWFSDLLEKTQEKRNTFKLETYLIGLYDRFFQNISNQNLTGVADYVFDTQDLSEQEKFEQIEENLSKDEETLEREKAFKNLKNNLDKLFEEAKKQKRYYISYVFELFKDNFEELEKDLNTFEEKVSSGEFQKEFDSNPEEFLAKYNEAFKRKDSNKFQSFEQVIDAERSFFDANKDNLISQVTNFAERAKTQAPASSKIFPESGALEPKYPYSIETVEEQANKNIEHVNLNQLVNSIVDNPYYVLPSGYGAVELFSKKFFGNDIFLKEFIKAQMQGIIYDATFREMNVSQPSPRQYAGDRSVRKQGGMIILSAPRFSAWLLKQKSKELAELAQKKIGKEFSVETLVDMINFQIDKTLAIITTDDATGEITRTPPDKIRAFINDPFYNWAGQIAFVSAFFDAEVKIVADLLIKRDNLTDEEATQRATKELSGEPVELFENLQKWVNENPEENIKNLANFFRANKRTEKVIQEKVGKNMKQVLSNFQFDEKQIENAENKIVEIVKQRLFPEGMSTFPLVRFYGKPEKDFGEEDFYDALGTPTLRNLQDFKGQKRSPQPTWFTEFKKSQIVDKLEANINQLVFELVSAGLKVEKPNDEIYEDFDQTNINLEKYREYLLQELEKNTNIIPKDKRSLSKMINKKIDNLMIGKFEGSGDKSNIRFEKEDTMFKDFETIPEEVYQDFVTEIIKDLLSNYLKATTQRFQTRGLEFKNPPPGYENTKVPRPYVPALSDLALLNVLSEEIIDKIKQISEQYGGRLKKYREWQQKTNTDIGENTEDITEASTQNLQRKVVSSTLQEMINKYASKR